MKSIADKLLEAAESVVFCKDYYPLKTHITDKGRLFLVVRFLFERIRLSLLRTISYEISALVYSSADERVLIPVLSQLLDRLQNSEKKVRVNLVLLRKLNPSITEELTQKGCRIEPNFASILRPCLQPQGKLVLSCVEQRLLYRYHQQGVDTADTLKRFGVRTASIQHGGTRADAVEALASSASDFILVWGQRVFRELIHNYGVAPERLRIVGNHLHDRIPQLNKDEILAEISKYFPDFAANSHNKKIVLLATCLHTEYDDRENGQALYAKYIQHLYQSVDFSKTTLIVKMHPADKTDPNLYWEFMPEALRSSHSIYIVEPSQRSLDVYSLLLISDLLVTRASTVAEEALLMQKKVVAFDLDEAGPSKAYRHLEDYGSYQTVYQSPDRALSEAISTALTAASGEATKQAKEIESDLTYCLDGQSIDRTVNELLNLLYSSPESALKKKEGFGDFVPKEGAAPPPPPSQIIQDCYINQGKNN